MPLPGVLRRLGRIRTSPSLHTGRAADDSAAAPRSWHPEFVPVEIGGFTFTCAIDDGATDWYSEWVRRGAETTLPVEWALRVIETGWTALDLGANLGTVAFPLAHACRRVIAVEALPRNAALLSLAAAANTGLPVVPVHAAVSSERGCVAMTGGSAWARTSADAVGDVAALTVADIVAIYGDGPIDLVKIDIEGDEHDVLPDVLALAADRDRFVLIYESNQAVADQDVRWLHQRVVDAGFRSWYLDPVAEAPTPVDPDRPQHAVNCDVLALRGRFDVDLPTEFRSDEELAHRLAHEIASHPLTVHRCYARAAVEVLPDAVQRDPAIRAALALHTDDDDQPEARRFRSILS